MEVNYEQKNNEDDEPGIGGDADGYTGSARDGS